MSKPLVVILVAAAALAGCKKKEDTPAGSAAGSSAGSAGSAAGSAAAAPGSAAADPGPPATCKDAGKNYAKVLAADPSSVLGGAEDGPKGLIKYSYEEACDTGWPEAWSETMKSCVANAQTSTAARACFSSNTLAQLDAMTKAEIEDMMKNKAANAAAAAAAGSGSAAAGSATP